MAAVTSHSVTKDNLAKRQRLMHAFAAFLDTELAGLGLTLSNCGPMDVLIFRSEHYIPSMEAASSPMAVYRWHQAQWPTASQPSTKASSSWAEQDTIKKRMWSLLRLFSRGSLPHIAIP